MPERQTTMPEGQQEDREPEGQQAVNRDGVPCAAHSHVLHRAPKVPEGRTGSTWVTRATGGVRQPAAALIATSPEALRLLLERRRQEARARLLVREQARRWELWRRWAWCRGSCGAAVLQAGGRGMMARRRARAERVGAGEGWLFVAGWRDGLVPLGADMADMETNMADMETNISEVVAEVQPGHGARSMGASGVISEVQAAGTLQAAARALLAQRRVAAEMARVRAELDEPGWLRASALELEKLLQAEAAGAGAAPTVAEAAATEAAAAAAAAAGKARRRAETRAGRKRAARAAEAVATQARAEAAAEARLAAEAEAEAEATGRAAADAVAAVEAEAEARLAAIAAVRMALVAARAAEAEEAAAVEAVARAAEEAQAAAEAAAEAEAMARVAAEAAGAVKAAAAASTKARRALPRAARGRPGVRGAGGVGAEVVMAEEMAAEANRHARRMAAWAEEARAAEAAVRVSVGEQAARRLSDSGARVEGDGCGWRDEVRCNLEAAFARAARRVGE